MGFLVHGSEVLVVGVALLGFWVANSVLSSGRKPREQGGDGRGSHEHCDREHV